MTKAFWLAAATLWPAAGLAAAAPAPALAPSPCGAVAAAPVSGYPTFCGIPRTPTDVRPPAAFKAAVVNTRKAGARLVAATAPETFSLDSARSEDFGQAARAQATWPADVASPPATDPEAFAAEARRAATPPARPHP